MSAAESILEKFKTSKEALNFIKEVPISSAQNIILADKYGDIFLIECNCDRAEVIENDYVFTELEHIKAERMQK